jgi:L-alanine-DL-glutamate epimerase-like enolase superfamily enzyme
MKITGIELPRCEDGAFRVPDRPGHGMALAPSAQKYRRA